MNTIKRKSVFRVSVLDRINLFNTFEKIRNKAPPIKAIPDSPKIKEIPILGNTAALTIVNPTNNTAAYIGRYVSFLRNGSTKKNKEMGILKYCTPPHEAFASPRRRPPNTAFGTRYFISLCLIADRNKYTASKPRSSPSGSDLNHPRLPL